MSGGKFGSFDCPNWYRLRCFNLANHGVPMDVLAPAAPRGLARNLPPREGPAAGASLGLGAAGSYGRVTYVDMGLTGGDIHLTMYTSGALSVGGVERKRARETDVERAERTAARGAFQEALQEVREGTWSGCGDAALSGRALQVKRRRERPVTRASARMHAEDDDWSDLEEAEEGGARRSRPGTLVCKQSAVVIDRMKCLLAVHARDPTLRTKQVEMSWGPTDRRRLVLNKDGGCRSELYMMEPETDKPGGLRFVLDGDMVVQWCPEGLVRLPLHGLRLLWELFSLAIHKGERALTVAFCWGGGGDDRELVEIAPLGGRSFPGWMPSAGELNEALSFQPLTCMALPTEAVLYDVCPVGQPPDMPEGDLLGELDLNLPSRCLVARGSRVLLWCHRTGGSERVWEALTRRRDVRGYCRVVHGEPSPMVRRRGGRVDDLHVEGASSTRPSSDVALHLLCLAVRVAEDSSWDLERVLTTLAWTPEAVLERLPVVAEGDPLPGPTVPLPWGRRTYGEGWPPGYDRDMGYGMASLLGERGITQDASLSLRHCGELAVDGLPRLRLRRFRVCGTGAVSPPRSSLLREGNPIYCAMWDYTKEPIGEGDVRVDLLPEASPEDLLPAVPYEDWMGEIDVVN